MATKAVYLFDENTGEYLHAYSAPESPLEPGIFLEPIFSTALVPPAAGQNEAVVFAAGAWSLVADYRGQTIYDQTSGAAQTVAALGAIPAGFALTPKPPTLQEQAQKALDYVTGARGQVVRAMAAGVVLDAAWVAYIQALRAIANGTDKASTALPVQPAYIAGT